MKKIINNRGFMLVETLIIAVFVVSMFTIVYTNFFPLMGEYEKREVYDDIDGKYAAYWIKRIIQHHSWGVNLSTLNSSIASDGYFLFNCNQIGDASTKKMCNELIKTTQVNLDDHGNPKIYVTDFRLGSVEGMTLLKERMLDNNTFSGGMHRYVDSLPNYNKTRSLNGAHYRVIVEFHRTKDGNNYMAYSNIEVKK